MDVFLDRVLSGTYIYAIIPHIICQLYLGDIPS